MTERQLYKQFKTYVDGFYTRVENTISSGMPDTIAVINERTVCIELKMLASGGVIFRPSQIIWHLEYIKAGGIHSYLLVGSRDNTVRLYNMKTIMRCKRVPFNKHFVISLRDVKPLAIDWAAIKIYFNQI